jgi:hypothetical protein
MQTKKDLYHEYLDLKKFKDDYNSGLIKLPKPKWAESETIARLSKIPEHNVLSFQSSELFKSCEIESILEGLVPYHRKTFRDKELFHKNLEDWKIYRIYRLWNANKALTPPVIRAFATGELEIEEGNHRIKLSLHSGVKNIPVLVAFNPLPFENNRYKQHRQIQ